MVISVKPIFPSLPPALANLPGSPAHFPEAGSVLRSDPSTFLQHIQRPLRVSSILREAGSLASAQVFSQTSGPLIFKPIPLATTGCSLQSRPRLAWDSPGNGEDSGLPFVTGQPRSRNHPKVEQRSPAHSGSPGSCTRPASAL